MPAPKPPAVLGIFYGYPASVIAAWCGVSEKTAELYKAGARKPSRQALRLFSLHRDGRVLTQDWRGWSVHKGKIVDPEGNETTQGLLRNYALILQWVHEVSKADPERRQQYYDLLRAVV